MFRTVEGKDTFKGHILADDTRTFKCPTLMDRQRVLTELIRHLTVRYADLDFPVFANARILDFRTWSLNLENNPGKGN
jgi:hypothetical protein